jgi:hypothetical protein
MDNWVHWHLLRFDSGGTLTQLIDLLVRYLMPSSRASQQSLGRCHPWRLFADLCRVDDEFERVGILVLLHQLR